MSEPYQPAQTVDARNLACPMPIVKTRKAMDLVEPVLVKMQGGKPVNRVVGFMPEDEVRAFAQA
ncbi:MAG TPA: sulfurtransferase TusA family protein [Symbiobacteriaceae bacterium]|nr:sulfurtransferase TusA family protein [Symbiobacteriaceae bacterium]